MGKRSSGFQQAFDDATTAFGDGFQHVARKVGDCVQGARNGAAALADRVPVQPRDSRPPAGPIRSLRDGFGAGAGAVAGLVGATTGAGIAIGGAALLAYAGGRCCARLAGLWRRRRALSKLGDRRGVAPGVCAAIDFATACVNGVYEEEDIVDVEQWEEEDAAPGAAGGAAGANAGGEAQAAAPPAPRRQRRRVYLNPYKGDFHRASVHQSFWVSLAAAARSRWGRIQRTTLNVEAVYQWCRREALTMTATRLQPGGSIRHEHLNRYLPMVVESVFVISTPEIDLDEAVRLIAAAGRVRGGIAQLGF